MGALDGKVVLVTGASRGIGAASARAAAAEGARVVCAARSTQALDDLVAQIATDGGEATAVHADVAVASSVEAMVGQAIARFGRLDGAVNNAGVLVPGFVADLADEDWDAVMGVNLRGVFLCMKHELRAMLEGGRGGAIVNVASIGAHRGVKHVPAYSASKHGVIGLTKSAALEYGEHGIRINAVSPGAVPTELVAGPGGPVDTVSLAADAALHRMGIPEEIANVVVFLLSDAASFMTGVTTHVDGGRVG
jgi:A-factor type gamma-butyrolactone 1'-reductase (1S-forming)